MASKTTKKVDPDAPPCIRTGCPRPQYNRGLCINDYQVASRAVKLGQVSWSILEAAGKVLAAKPRKRGAALAWLLDGVELPPKADEVAPPLPVAAVSRATVEEDLAQAFSSGTPAREVERKFNLATSQVMEAARKFRARGGTLLCRCRREWGHKGMCTL